MPTGVDADSDEDSTKRPFYKSPFFWGFVIGAIALTAIRPLMRKVPDPPPVGAALPAIEATEIDRESGEVRGGATIHRSAGTDAIMVLTIASAECDDACRRALDVASKVERRMSRADIPAEFVTIAPHTLPTAAFTTLANEHFPYAEDWRLLRVAETSTLASILDARSDVESSRTFSTIASEGYLWIVDAEGHLRGRYDSGADDATAEVFHRSLHVLGRY
jgi:hypothetical protein